MRIPDTSLATFAVAVVVSLLLLPTCRATFGPSRQRLLVATVAVQSGPVACSYQLDTDAPLAATLPFIREIWVASRSGEPAEAVWRSIDADPSSLSWRSLSSGSGWVLEVEVDRAAGPKLSEYPRVRVETTVVRDSSPYPLTGDWEPFDGRRCPAVTQYCRVPGGRVNDRVPGD